MGRLFFASLLDHRRMQIVRMLCFVFYGALLAGLLASCGGAATASGQQTASASPKVTVIPTPTPTDTPTPTPTPTPKPTPKPTPTPMPTSMPTTQVVVQQPVPAPILDVAPASMSLVGHLDCSRTAGVFVCQAAVISGASNQATLHWVAFANIGGVGFNPAQGNLAPGTRVILTIRIPAQECVGTFFFQGPANTHTIGWQC